MTKQKLTVIDEKNITTEHDKTIDRIRKEITFSDESKTNIYQDVHGFGTIDIEKDDLFKSMRFIKEKYGR